MTYLEWNNAIIKHFFNPEKEEKEVMLYFSETIIDEIGNNNFAKPDEGYIENFYKALRLGVPGIDNENYIDRILALEKKYRDGCKGIADVVFEYPPYFSYILAFILPFTSGAANEDFNMNNFHDYVKEFFEEKQLTKNYVGHIKNRLIDIDGLWKKINDWLMDEKNFSFGILEEIIPPQQRKFVGKFEYHILFRKEQEERLSMVFDENDILPGGAISENEVRRILINNYQRLKLSINTKNRINDPEDYIGRKILKRVLSFYKNWNGIIHTVEGQRGYSRNRLVLCLDFNLLNQRINLKYFRIFSINGIPENLRLEKRDGVFLEDKIHQINSFYSNPILNCFVDLNTNIQLVDNSARIKYNWKDKKFYIFKKISDFDWVEIPKVDYNAGKTVIICKNIFYENELKYWFENISGSKRLFNNNALTNLPNDWLALTVESITDYPHLTIQELIPDPELKPKINFDKSFYIDGKLFKDKLPIVWLENTETIDKVIAKYEDGSEIPLNQLTKDDEGISSLVNQFTFSDEHIISGNLNQQFKLVCNNISTHRFLQITDFKKRNNTEIENLLPKRDVIGQLTLADENYFKGIEHFFTQNKIAETIPFQNQMNNVFINRQNNENYRQSNEYNSQHLGNILIHYISSRGQLGKKEFEDCVFSLLLNTNSESNQKKNPAIQLGYLLQDLCYVDYNPEKSIFIINKPHLVIIPTDSGTTFKLIGAIDFKLIKDILNYCRHNTNITIDIKTDDSNILLPQAIYLNLKQCRHELILPFVRQFNIIFNKFNLYTQFALPACFPDIGKWRNYISETSENEIKDTEGGYLFNIESLKFENKPYDFNKDLSFIRLTNINGYKTLYRLWYNSTCFSIPDQQLGIYLFLYLYKQVAMDNEDAQLKTNILVFDAERKLLAVPLNCMLPRYFSMSFHLMSGKLNPIKKLRFIGVRYDGPYYIYQNIPKLFFENNLNNKLLKRTPRNPIFNKQIIL
ncbi:MAG: hypothetical protein IPN61_18805 [Bacteroidetes bacterium]|nr:hypothetical protein [Bacteroidota bacterium]